MGPGYLGAAASLRNIKFSAARLPSGAQVEGEMALGYFLYMLT